MKRHAILKNSIKCVIILSLATLLAFAFLAMQVRIENIIMVYLIAILFLVIETSALLWGIIGSVLSILLFNFFFTEPHFTFMIDDPNYIITMIIFLIAACLASSLMSKLQLHAQVAKYNEQQTNSLYQMTRGYLNLSGIDTIIYHHIRDLYRYQAIRSVVYYYEEKTKQLNEYFDETISLPCPPEKELAQWCFQNGCDCGKTTAFYEDRPWLYRPLMKGTNILGVYAIYLEAEIDKEHRLFQDTMSSQLVLALEREHLYEAQEENKIEIEKEKLRNQLLRSVSHDLRTPLTGISGNTSLLLANYEKLDQKSILGMLKDIDEDAIWLNHLVENLLNMTRIQDGKLLVHKQKEVVDDILCTVSERCERFKQQHTLEIQMPDHVILVEMDAQLIIQVLFNLIDNAFRHTQDDSHIQVKVWEEKTQVVFEVSDNGPGIEEGLLEHIFESFVTTGGIGSDCNRGAGLGLSIAKAMIEAHHGVLTARNREEGGACFRFTLPKEDEK